MSGRSGASIQAGGNIGDCPAKLGVGFEGVTSDVAKRLGEGLCCKLKRRACLGIGGALREHFDEQDAE